MFFSIELITYYFASSKFAFISSLFYNKTLAHSKQRLLGIDGFCIALYISSLALNHLTRKIPKTWRTIRHISKKKRTKRLKKVLYYNQTLKRKKEQDSYSDVKIRYLRECLDFSLEPVYSFYALWTGILKLKVLVFCRL